MADPTRPTELVTLLDRTLPDAAESGVAPRRTDPADVGRYAFRSVLGVGGMGEVRLCRDPQIGRDVAVKIMHARADENSEARRRFVREARVQGQLEHPSIVPVYDLGTGASGESYFAMKRVRGMTLAEVIAALAACDPAAVQRFSRRKLLSAFANVCLAVDFAHARGVVHRDLKPGNIMLGDFGEVYVLDWGVARVIGEAEPELGGDAVDPGDVTRTASGRVMGTPGYMAPEQLRGETATADARADIYALGAILFELLTYEPLHQGADMVALMVSTLEPQNASAAMRAPARDVPPELDQLYQRATALTASERPASAREVADAVERYLDGDRDLALRRSLADAHAREAEALATAALAADGTSAEPRRRALNEVGRALALDPSHRGARTTLVGLLTSPPHELPAAATAAMNAARVPVQVTGARMSALGFAAWVAAIPVFVAMGIESVPALVFFAATHVLVVAMLLWIARQRRLGGAVPIAARVFGLLSVVSLSSLMGPLVLVPTAALGVMTTMSLHPSREVHWGSAWFTCIAIAVPLALQALGVLPASYAFRDGAVVILPGMVALPPTTTLVLLFLANSSVILAAGLVVQRVRRTLMRAERAAHLNAWQLQQLVPD